MIISDFLLDSSVYFSFTFSLLVVSARVGVGRGMYNKLVF